MSLIQILWCVAMVLILLSLSYDVFTVIYWSSDNQVIGTRTVGEVSSVYSTLNEKGKRVYVVTVIYYVNDQKHFTTLVSRKWKPNPRRPHEQMIVMYNETEAQALPGPDMKKLKYLGLSAIVALAILLAIDWGMLVGAF